MSEMKLAEVSDEDVRRESLQGDEKLNNQKRIAYQIQDAGGVRNWLVDELMKDRTEQGDAESHWVLAGTAHH